MISICYAVDASYEGGAERYVELLMSALDRTIFRPSLLVKRTPGLRTWTERMRASGIEVVDVEMNLPFRPVHAPRIIGAIRSLGPHIVHMNMPGPYDAQMGVLAPLARIAGAARVVATEHLPMVEKLPKRAFVKRCAYRWVDTTVTVCEANVPWLVGRQAVPRDMIAVVHNGLPEAYGRQRDRFRSETRRELELAGEEIALCITGSLIRRKGHHLLIEALAGATGPPWHLFIIGDGEERSAIERQLGESGLRSRTSLLGWRPPAEVERLLAAMDIFVLPSVMEAFPYTILEAMACGLPVIASRIYGIPEAAIDGETALLVEPSRRGALTEALDRLMRDPGLRTRFGAAARTRFENRFTLDVQMRRMHSIYAATMGC